MIRPEGPDSLSVALAYNNLGAVHYSYSQRHYDQAEALYQRALEIREKIQGTDHPNLVTPLVNLASLYHKTGRKVDADAFEQRAAAIREAKR